MFRAYVLTLFIAVASVATADGVGVKEAWRCSLRTSEFGKLSVYYYIYILSLATVSFNHH